MATLTREAIFERSRSRTKSVAVPDWGGDVMVRPLTAGEVQSMADVFSGGERDLRSNMEAAFLLVAAAAIDDNGKPMFESPDDLKALDVGPIVQLATAIAELSGITGGDNAGK